MRIEDVAGVRIEDAMRRWKANNDEVAMIGRNTDAVEMMKRRKGEGIVTMKTTSDKDPMIAEGPQIDTAEMTVRIGNEGNAEFDDKALTPTQK